MSKTNKGGLTTHVLDTMHGKPAKGMVINFYEIVDGQRQHIKQVITNEDGRIDSPILQGEAFKFGQFELEFHVADYFKEMGVALSDPAFIDVVPLRFGISENSHYHVPLLVSPYSYSTYRGS